MFAETWETLSDPNTYHENLKKFKSQQCTLNVERNSIVPLMLPPTGGAEPGDTEVTQRFADKIKKFDRSQMPTP